MSIIVIGSDIDGWSCNPRPTPYAIHSAPQQQGRGVQCSRADDNRAGIDDLSIGETHSDGATIFEQHAIDDRVGPDLEVGAVPRWFEVHLVHRRPLTVAATGQTSKLRTVD